MRCIAILIAASAILSAEAWKTPRHSSGQPDISGYFSNSTITPFERPAELGSKEFYTEDEYKQFLKKPITQPGSNDPHYDMSQYGLDVANQSIAKNLRTSWITGPDGKVPAYTPEAAKRVAAANRERAAHSFESYEYRSSSERCLWMASEGPPLSPFQGAYNANLEIRQSPGYVVIMPEMIHDARVIPIDTRPHGTVPQWFGDARGHWEGDTLVVETVNFNGKTGFRGATEKLKVTERFTRTGKDTILYQFTVEDPDTWVRPWSGESPMQRIEGPIYEYACHEGNMGMPNILTGARSTEGSK